MNGYMTAREAAEKWHVNMRYVQILCAEGKLEGAQKFGSVWAIPEDLEMVDHRVKSGAYRNWRKKKDPG